VPCQSISLVWTSTARTVTEPFTETNDGGLGSFEEDQPNSKTLKDTEIPREWNNISQDILQKQAYTGHSGPHEICHKNFVKTSHLKGFPSPADLLKQMEE